MDRNREVRRASMAAVNGSLRKRQQRSTNLRDSPEEDGGTEMQETSRLRDRDRDRGSKKDRDRDRDRDRSSSRSKRRRGERSMHGINRDEGDDSSDESMDDDYDDEDEDATVTIRLTASATNPPSSSSSMQLQQQNQHVRKCFPVKPARAPAPAWKVAEEMIGVSIPRKARSSSLKRSPECFPGVGGELMHRQPSTSPARPSPSSNTAVSPPSSSNASSRKKKQIGGSNQHRPPSTKISKSSPSSEIEIEVAEVLFGMTRQSLVSSSAVPSSSSSRLEAHQKLDTKEISGLSGEAKSRISSPVSSPPSSVLPSNNKTAPLVAIAPKRKRPRIKVDEEIPTSPPAKAEAELPSKMEAPASVPASPLRSEKKMAATSPVVENGTALTDVGDHKQDLAEFESCNHSPEPKEVEQEIATATSKSKEAPCSDLDVNLEESASAKAGQAPVADIPREEKKFSIDLMAPPPVLLGNSEKDVLSEYAADHKSLELVKEMKLDTVNGGMEQDIASKPEAMETASMEGRSTGKSITNEIDIKKHADRPNLDLQLDLEKQDNDSVSLICSSKHQQQMKQQSKTPKIDPKLEKNAHPPSLPLTMPIAGWPGNFPHFGYMGQVPSVPAVIPIDGTSATSKTMQPHHFFPPQKPKRCATHCYIAQTIYYNQQIARMNSFWPPATAPLYGAKQYNLNVIPPSEAAAIIGNPLQGGFPGRNLGLLPDKASPAVAMTYAGPPPKEKSSVAVAAAAASNTFMEAAQRKQFLLQQTPPQAGSSAAPPNMIHTPAAFIFPMGQQPAATARSAGSKSNPGIGNAAPAAPSASSAAAPSSMLAGHPPTTMSFNYAGMSPNDAQYLAILQNNAYPFPLPAHVGGGPSPYRGVNPAQAMPFFNGSFYSSAMMHPSSQQQQHLRHHQPLVANQQPPPQPQQGHQNTSTSSGSSSSHKHHSQRVPGGGGAAPTATAAGGNNYSFPGSKQHLHLLPPQARQLESEAGREDSPSTVDSSRVSNQAQKSIYGPNFGMSIHPQNFALISPAAAEALPGSGAVGGSGNHSEKQLVGNQAYAMSFPPVGAPGLDFSSMMQNHPLYQSLPEAVRQHGYQQITAAHAQHKKPHHEDKKSGDSATVNANQEGKMMASGAGKATSTGAQHSLSFSRPDNDPPISGILGSSSNITEGPSRTLNLIQPPANGGRVTSRPSSAAPASNSSAATATNPSMSSPRMQQLTQQQQQHLMQLQRQQQQQQQVQQQMQFQQQMSSRAAKSSSQNPNNAAMYSDRMPSGSPMGRFPQVGLAGFPPSVIHGSSAAQSPQWKASGTAVTPGPSTSATSSSSSVKNQLPQQQQQQQQQQHQGRAQQQPLLSSNQHQTHISFGVNPSKAVGVMGQPHLSGPSINSSLTSVAAAMAAGSPQNSATKSSPGNGGSGNGGNGSPRAPSSSKTGPPPATLLSPALPLQQQQQSQNAKNSPSSLSSNIKSSPANNRNMTSILGHPHMNAASNSNSSAKFQQQAQQQQQKQQQQQQQQSFHQPQLFFSNPYMQAAQSSQSNAAAAAANFYQQQRRQSEQQSQQQQQQQQNSTNISLCPSAPSDPSKAAATGTSGEGSGILQHGAQFSSSSMGQQNPLISTTTFPHMHTVVSSVSVKPAPDPKAATGSDNLHWKPDRR